MDAKASCSVCLAEECVNPARLPCGHTLCHVCVRSVDERCPFCRKQFDTTSRFYWGS